MVKDLKMEQIKDPLTEAIGAAYFIKGNKNVVGKDIKDICDYVSKTLKESFTTYRIPEVCQAIELGARGELFAEQDMNVVSPENIFKWIHRYNGKIRREAIDKQKRHEEKIDKEVEESEQKEKVVAFEKEIQECYLAYCESFELPEDMPMGLKATYCRHLYAKNLIELTADQEKEIFDKAKKLLPTEADIRGMNAVDRAFHNKKKEAQIQEIAESIALEYLFAEYLKQDINL